MGIKKIKPVKKSQKKPAPAPDTAFAKAKQWADKNYAIVFGACAAILFTIISLWGFSAYDRSKQVRAQSDYGLLASRLPAEGKGSPADWEKLIPDLQKFISEHSGTAPALNARDRSCKGSAGDEALRGSDQNRRRGPGSCAVAEQPKTSHPVSAWLCL